MSEMNGAHAHETSNVSITSPRPPRSDGLCEWDEIGNHKDRRYRDEGDIDAALDRLLTGVTTFRDDDGVARPEDVEGLPEWAKEMLLNLYDRAELWPPVGMPSAQEVLDRISVDGDVEPHAVRQLTPSEWRAVVEHDEKFVDDLVRKLVYGWFASEFRTLPRHMRWAIQNHHDVVRQAFDKIESHLKYNASYIAGG